MTVKPRVLVYGTGVIGSIYAVRLANSGHDVTVVARGDRLAAIREGGLVIRQVFLDEEENAEVQVTERLDPDADHEIVLVTVRAGQILGVLHDVARIGRARAVVVVGNNLEAHAEQASVVGPSRFVLGFGAFGGYRDRGVIAYLDGRTKERAGAEARRPTTLGVLAPEARPALELAAETLQSAGLPNRENGAMAAWLICHAALVFPLAGAIYACGGEQERTCRTRDAILLGVRSCRELMRALRSLGVRTEPRDLRSLLAMPEPLLHRYLQGMLAGESARIAMFFHACSRGGREEMSGQAAVLDRTVRKAGRRLESWDRLLPFFAGGRPPLPDGSRELRLRLW